MQDTDKGTRETDKPGVYQIRVKGQLDKNWANWFDGMAVTLTQDGDTLLTGPAQDQAALLGLIAKVRDLGVTLVSVVPVMPDRADMPGGSENNPVND